MSETGMSNPYAGLEQVGQLVETCTVATLDKDEAVGDGMVCELLLDFVYSFETTEGRVSMGKFFSDKPSFFTVGPLL